MLYKLTLTVNSVYETLLCDHSNESYQVVLYSLFVDKVKI